MVPWRFDISRAQDAMFDSPHKNDKCNVYIPNGEPGRQHIRWVGRVNFQKLDQQTALPKELTKNPIPKVVLQMILLFPRVGFVGSVEGVDIKETNTRSCDGFFVGILNAGAAITIFVYTLTTAITPLFNVWRLGPTDRCWENHTISNWGFFKYVNTGPIEKCEYRTMPKYHPPYLFYFWIFQVFIGSFDGSK